MLQKVKSISVIVFFLWLISGCTYNPFSTQNRLTGNVAGTALGAGIGAGTMAILDAPKSLVWLGAIGGGAIGYYVTTLRYDAGGVIAVGGQVWQIGDYVYIDIPTDYLFEENTARFTDIAPLILHSTRDILSRYGNRSILVEGNTSGFDRSFRETWLSEKRARKVVNYLREVGINAFQENSIELRKITYVGNGDRFPIANHIYNNSIRQNSHIFIKVYPSKRQLGVKPYRYTFKDIGAMDDSGIEKHKRKCIDEYGQTKEEC